MKKLTVLLCLMLLLSIPLGATQVPVTGSPGWDIPVLAGRWVAHKTAQVVVYAWDWLERHGIDP